MKKYTLAIIPFILAIGCVVAFNVIGSEVAPDGRLIEPFFLIPIGYIFLLISIIISIVITIRNFYMKNKKMANIYLVLVYYNR